MFCYSAVFCVDFYAKDWNTTICYREKQWAHQWETAATCVVLVNLLRLLLGVVYVFCQSRGYTVRVCYLDQHWHDLAITFSAWLNSPLPLPFPSAHAQQASTDSEKASNNIYGRQDDVREKLGDWSFSTLVSLMLTGPRGWLLVVIDYRCEDIKWIWQVKRRGVPSD